MNSRTTRQFRDLLETLPAAVRRQTRAVYRQFRVDPSYPGLRFKQVHTPPPTYSVRIGIGYRAVGVLDGGIVIWFWVGSHADYDYLLDTL